MDDINKGVWKKITFSSWVCTEKPIHLYCCICNPSKRFKLVQLIIKILRVGRILQNIQIGDYASLYIDKGGEQ